MARSRPCSLALLRQGGVGGGGNSPYYNLKSYTTTRWSMLQLKSGPYHNRSQKTRKRTLLRSEQRRISSPRYAPRPFNVFWNAVLEVLLEWCWTGPFGMVLERSSWNGAGEVLLEWCWTGLVRSTWNGAGEVLLEWCWTGPLRMVGAGRVLLEWCWRGPLGMVLDGSSWNGAGRVLLECRRERSSWNVLDGFYCRWCWVLLEC